MSCPLPLLVGLPPHGEALLAQRANLERFVEEERDAFAALPYLPWTDERRPVHAPAVEVRPARVAPGLRGVYLSRAVQADGLRDRALLYYPGVLMTDDLFQRFYARFHCPTGLRVPSLDFKKAPNARSQEAITLVGDPTAPGAIVNDGAYGVSKEDARSRVNCELRSVSWDHLKRALRKEVSSGKQRVSAAIASVSILPHRTIGSNDELLVDYGSDFWPKECEKEEWCAQCFSKDHTADNPLVQCEGMAAHPAAMGKCLVSRHRLCFPAYARPSLQQLADANVRYYCPDHLPAAQQRMQLASSGAASAQPTASYPHAVTRTPSVLSSCEFGMSPKHSPGAQLALASSCEFGMSPKCARPAESAATKAIPPRQQAIASGCVQSPVCIVLGSSCAFGDSPGVSCSPPAGAAAVPQALKRRLSFDGGAVPTPMRAVPALPASAAGTGREVPAHGAQLLFRHGSCLGDIAEDDAAEFVGGEPDSWAAATDEELAMHSAAAAADSASDHYADPFYASPSECSAASSDSEHAQCLPTDSDSSSASDGSVQSLRGGRAVGGGRVSGAPPVDCVLSGARSISCRDDAQAKKLAGYKDAFHEFGLTQASLLAELGKYTKAWFLTREIKAFMRSATNTQPAHAPAAGPADAAAAAAAAVGVKDGKAASRPPRWCTLSALQHDWAEYRSCCGVDPKDSTKGAPNSWTFPIGMFRDRLVQQAACTTANAYKRAVRDLLFVHTASQEKVQYKGQQLCESCFRAVIGFGRTKMFALRSLVSPAERQRGSGKVAPLTTSGKPSFPRGKPVLERVVQLLKAHAEPVTGVGQAMPNSTSDKYERRIVPSISVPDLCAAISKELPQGHATVISTSTMHRAIQQLREQYRISVSTAKTKEMARCDTCTLCDNEVQLARNVSQSCRKRLEMALTQPLRAGAGAAAPAAASEHDAAHVDMLGKAVAEAQANVQTKLMLKGRHLREVRVQRVQYHEDRDAALSLHTSVPRYCLTLDGMDQKKTRLPLLRRDPKGLEKMPRLGVHAVGAVNYGGPVPVMGLLNFPDVRKDSSLTVTLIDRILDMQYRENQRRFPVPAAAPDAAAAPAPAPAAPADNVMSNPAVGDAWPAWLQLWFDNAAGENKNQWVFRYLGLLVLHGVFQAITVSTLIVGHTHGIVDQMFSVWARLLRMDDVLTFEQMRSRFQDKYTSRIEALQDLLKGTTITEERAQQLGFDHATMQQLLAMQEQARSGAREGKDLLTDLSTLAKQQLNLSPVVVRQETAIDVQGWMEQLAQAGLQGPHLDNLSAAQQKRIARALDKGAAAAKAGSIQDIYELTGLLNPHMFAIEKDAAGDVYLYNKLYVDSHEGKHEGVVHRYPKQLTGSYTTRALLWRAGDAAVSARIAPSNLPALPIDTEQLRKTIDAFLANKYFAAGSAEEGEWTALLAHMNARALQEGEACATCRQLVHAVNAIGVISRGQHLTEQQQQEAKSKDKARRTAQKALAQHLSDPAARGSHVGLSNPAFLSKWVQRVASTIRPSYIRRGILTNDADLEVPFTCHPLSMCTGVGEEPIYETDTRVPIQWYLARGAPQVGQLVLCRMAAANEPFWIGTVLHVGAAAEEAVSLAHVQAEEHERPVAAAAAAAAVALPGPVPAVACAPVGVGAPEQALHRGDRRRGRQAVVTLPQLRVQWWDICQADGKALHLGQSAAHQQYWTDLWKQHVGSTAAEWQAARDSSEEARPPSLAWVVDLYRSAHWVEMTRGEEATVAGDELILWGPPTLLLNACNRHKDYGRQVNAHAWTSLHADLTEQTHAAIVQPPKRARKSHPPRPTAGAAQAAQSATVSASAATPAQVAAAAAVATASGSHPALPIRVSRPPSKAAARKRCSATQAASKISQQLAEAQQTQHSDDDDYTAATSSATIAGKKQRTSMPAVAPQQPAAAAAVVAAAAAQRVRATGAALAHSQSSTSVARPTAASPARARHACTSTCRTTDGEAEDHLPLSHLMPARRTRR